MRIGNLDYKAYGEHKHVVAKSIQNIDNPDLLNDIFVAKIDPEYAGTEDFCNKYGVSLDISTNCLVVEAKRADKTWYAACLIMAKDSADINGSVRRQLGARRVSFAPIDKALELTGMEYGGITPIGLPDDWPVLVDEDVMSNDFVIIGGGVRSSKLAVKTQVFKSLKNVMIMQIIKS